MSINKNSESPHNTLLQQTEALLEKSPINIARAEIQKLVYEFQACHVELELQNEELLSSRNRYQKLYDCAPIGFLILNNQGYIIDANQTACELFACSKIELQGTKQAKYIHVEDQDSFYLFFKQLLNPADKQSIEFRIKQTNGHFINVACQGYCSHTKSFENEFFLTFQDISEQRRVEKAIYLLNEQLKQKICDQTSELLRKNKKLQENISEIKKSKQQLIEREAKLNSVFNAAVEGILTINESGIIESLNIAVSKIFGYQANELIGYNVNKLIPSPQKELQNNFFHNYLGRHQTEITGKIWQLEGRRKDGSLIPIDISISKYKIGRKYFFTSMIRDVSERKYKELQDKQHLNELAHVTRMGLMGEMASGIAHEVNQPLTAIATYCQVSLRLLKTDKLNLISLQEILQKTEKQALRAGKIIARMREFISSSTVHRSTVDINGLVQNAIDLATDDCRKFNIEYKLELADFLPFISADAIQIEQVLLNLIKNSIDALARLPKTIQRQLSIQTYFLETREIEVRVKDNGAGINDAEQGKIFTPFFTTKNSGMGMGLSICQSLIASHNGKLRFNCSKGKGTTFYFTLPVTENS